MTKFNNSVFFLAATASTSAGNKVANRPVADGVCVVATESYTDKKALNCGSHTMGENPKLNFKLDWEDEIWSAEDCLAGMLEQIPKLERYAKDYIIIGSGNVCKFLSNDLQATPVDVLNCPTKDESAIDTLTDLTSIPPGETEKQDWITEGSLPQASKFTSWGRNFVFSTETDCNSSIYKTEFKFFSEIKRPYSGKKAKRVAPKAAKKTVIV